VIEVADIMGKILELIRSEREKLRVCIYCHTPLVTPDGIVIETTYLIDYGLVCSECVEKVYPINAYEPGDDVSGTIWYSGYYLD
jgi:hypothetical protein